MIHGVASLTRYGRMAKNHWEKYRPRMVEQLKKDGVYHDALLNAQEQAGKLVAEQVSRLGNDVDSAREMALRLYVLLPSEEEQPVLEVDRMPFLDQEPTIEF